MLVDTSLGPRPAPRRWLGRILAGVARLPSAALLVLLAVLVGAAMDAQTKPSQERKPGANKHANAPRGSKSPKGSKAKAPKSPKAPDGSKGSKGSKAAAKAPPAPKGFPSASTTPPRTPIDKKAKAKAAAQLWSRVEGTLLAEYLARNPDRAFERPWPGISERHLGTFGSGATLRWRAVLTDALAELARLRANGLPWEARAQLGALQDWAEAELLLLDAQTPSTSDPAGYVQRALRALRSAREAQWMPPERRAAELEGLLHELAAYFRDARLSLIDPVAPWIDLALSDLDDLQELVGAIEASLPEKPAPRSAKARKAATPDQDPRSALEGFRAWLLELRPNAGNRPPSLGADEWQRLAVLRSGTAWTASEFKARGLRELARLDLVARKELERSPRSSGEEVTDLAWNASALALQTGREARLLRTRLGPEALEFALEPSLRTRPEIARIAPGGADSLRVLLAEPHGSWPPARTITRNRSLESAAAALGLRYGPAGEGLFELESRACQSATAMLLDNRLLREGLGLYALDWVRRVEWVATPFRADEELALALDFQRGLEAARLVAALEVHAEGLSFEEAAQGFERRTGMDPDSARAEVLAAARDPLHGLGYLGLVELLTLEERFAGLVGKRQGLRLGLLLAARHPDLRPSDLAGFAGRGSSRKRKGAGTGAQALENPARTQQELSRSR